MDPSQHMTVDEYLAFEERAETKHEYHDGIVVAMTGATRDHNQLSGAIFTALFRHLRGRPCRAYMADFRVRIEASNRYLYPDVVVACEDSPSGRDLATEQPRLVVEVLSPSTAGYDRGYKFQLYRSIESLQEYLLVETDVCAVDRYRKTPDGVWTILPRVGPGDTLCLQSVELELAVHELYEDTEARADSGESVTP